MDHYLQNGRLESDLCGGLKSISGTEELIQRALIRLVLKKGSFPYDRSLGSELTQLSISQIDDNTLYSVVQEALKDLQGIQLLAVEKNVDYEMERLYLTVFLRIHGKDAQVSLWDPKWEE